MQQRIARSVYTAALLLAATATMVPAADFLPLEPNNEWVYRHAATGEKFQVRVGSPVFLRDRLYYQLHGYTEQPLMVRHDDRGQLLAWDEENERDLLLISFEPFEQGRWNAHFRPCDQEGQTQEKRTVYDGPAGPVRDVLEIQYRIGSCADTGITGEQFAENIGMLRRVVTSFAGPKTFELAYARVGRTIIDAIPAGRFTVSAEQNQAAASIRATLRLQTNPTSVTLPLTFPTSQEFDVVLKDEEGKVVWVWSDGKAFVQAVRTKLIQGEWSAAVDIPKPPSTGQPRAAIYTIQAWLVTLGPLPQFAATVPVTITTGLQ